MPVRCEACSAQIDGSTRMYDDLMSEYAFAGMGDYREAAFLAKAAKGSRVFDLRFQGYRMETVMPVVASGSPRLGGALRSPVMMTEAFGYAVFSCSTVACKMSNGAHLSQYFVTAPEKNRAFEDILARIPTYIEADDALLDAWERLQTSIGSAGKTADMQEHLCLPLMLACLSEHGSHTNTGAQHSGQQQTIFETIRFIDVVGISNPLLLMISSPLQHSLQNCKSPAFHFFTPQNN